MSPRHLGKSSPRIDYRTLHLERYLSLDKLPVVPSVIDWGATQHAPWGAMRNDEMGNCVFAAQGHLVQLWTHNRPDGAMVTVPDSAVVAAYSEVTGYVEGDPSTDRGAVMLEGLKHWRKTGIGGHKILAFATVNPKHEAMVRAAMWLFGGLYAGYALPDTARDQAVWIAPPSGNAIGKYAPGSWGGHAAVHSAHRRDGASCLTWGYAQPMTQGFVETYCDELYAVLSEDWLTNGKSLAGFDLQGLLADLGRVTR